MIESHRIAVGRPQFFLQWLELFVTGQTDPQGFPGELESVNVVIMS